MSEWTQIKLSAGALIIFLSVFAALFAAYAISGRGGVALTLLAAVMAISIAFGTGVLLRSLIVVLREDRKDRS